MTRQALEKELDELKEEIDSLKIFLLSLPDMVDIKDKLVMLQKRISDIIVEVYTRGDL